MPKMLAPSKRTLAPLFALAVSAAACSPSAPVPSDASTAADGSARCESDVECSDAIYCNGIESCAPSLPTADARGCVRGAPPCGARACVEEMQRCTEALCPDSDGDGRRDAACGGDDCDDDAAERAPGLLEICDAAGLDEDCDLTTFGERDADSDGAIDAACCNGARCGADCDDTRAGVGPTSPEVCNGSDDDCDGASDEGFECSAADTETARACRTSCGSLGSQACTAACVWSACVASDEGPSAPGTCNRCDDDADGALDEGFACVQGAFLPCTTQCGSAGIGFCTASCELPGPTPSECLAATETCNYCDDDADGTFLDDRGLVEPVPVVWTTSGCGGVSPGAGATCGGASVPLGGVLFEGDAVSLSDGVTTSGRWQAWASEPGEVGWSTVSIDVSVWADHVADEPDGGWALVVARGPCGAGPTNDVGVPLDCVGIAVEWRFGGIDRVSVRRLEGSGEGVLIGHEPSVAAPVGLDWDDVRRPMRLILDYHPDVPGSPANENAFSVAAPPARGSGPILMQRDTSFGIGEIPRGELRVGDEVHVGVVSATGASRTRVDWMLSGAFQFLSLPPATLASSQACAPR